MTRRCGRTYLCAAIKDVEQTPFHPFFAGLTYISRRKSDANKQDFENKLNLTCQAQSTPKTIRILTNVFCTSGPNLVILAERGDELRTDGHTHRQTDAGNDNTRRPKLASD